MRPWSPRDTKDRARRRVRRRKYFSRSERRIVRLWRTTEAQSAALVFIGRFEPFQRFGEFIVNACHSLGAGGIGLSFILGLDAGQDEVFFAVVPGGAEQLPPGSGSAGRLGQQQVVPAGRIESMPGLPRFQKFIQLAVVVGQGA